MKLIFVVLSVSVASVYASNRVAPSSRRAAPAPSFRAAPAPSFRAAPAPRLRAAPTPSNRATPTPSYRAAPPQSTSGTTISYAPNTRSLKEVQRDLYSWPKNGVSIHDIQVRDAKVLVSGTYFEKVKFEGFLKRLRGEDSSVKREVNVKETPSSRYVDFTAEVDNQW